MKPKPYPQTLVDSYPTGITAVRHVEHLKSETLPAAQSRAVEAQRQTEVTSAQNRKNEADLLNGNSGERHDARVAFRTSQHELAASQSDLADIELHIVIAEMEASVFYSSIGRAAMHGLVEVTI